MNLKTILSFVLHSDLRARTRKSPGSDCALCAFSFKYVDTHTWTSYAAAAAATTIEGTLEGNGRHGTVRYGTLPSALPVPYRR